MMVAVSGEGAWSVTTSAARPHLHRLGRPDRRHVPGVAAGVRFVADAVGHTADIVYSVLEKTTSLDQRELALGCAGRTGGALWFHFEVTQIS